jgi:hypothetical protein
MPTGEKELKPGFGTGIVEALSRHCRRQLDATVQVADRAPGTKVSIVHVDSAHGDAGSNEMYQLKAQRPNG